MDSQSRAFEVPVEAIPAGTPLPCPQTMMAQPIQVWTPARILGALAMALISTPAQLVPIARRRA
jgi:hypothetical protein